MIQMEVTFCRLDDRPISSSGAYKLIKLFVGERIANSLTYTVDLPEEVQEDADRMAV